jgi:ATP-binding cassette, subfamily C, bacterial LapB
MIATTVSEAEKVSPALASSNLDQATQTQTDPLIHALVLALKLHGLDISAEALTHGVPPTGRNGRFVVNDLLRAADNNGALIVLKERKLEQISALVLPVILILKNGDAVVYKNRTDDGQFVLCSAETGMAQIAVAKEALEASYCGFCLFVRPPREDSSTRREYAAGDPNDSSNTAQSSNNTPKKNSKKGHWFWSTMWRFKGYYVEVAVATVMINVLALAGTFFTMNVYDRVIPNLAFVTLWTLATGVALAMAFEFIARNLRAWLLDSAGKKADLLLGSALFRQTLQIRLEQRSASPGAYANNLKDFESVRDFVSSATMAALADLPFMFLFIAVIGMIAGPLMWVAILAVPTILIANLIVQIPLARLIGENMKESSIKSGVLVEAVEGIETIKALRAESWLQRQYEVSSALTARTGMKSRLLSNVIIHFCSSVQMFVTVVAVVWGVYLIADGQLTMGGLIGAVMLMGRALAPISQITALSVRFQQARSALTNLNRIMNQPTDREFGRSYMNKSGFQGELSARGLSYKYANDGPEVLKGFDIHIKPGERVVILGRIGSGKSTALKILAGLYHPNEGHVYLDQLDIAQIEPDAVRRNLAFVGQEARLFHGTLRQNLLIGNPQASDEWMLRVATATGVADFAKAHPRGYDMVINERGEGLSGGQRQAVAIARALISRPSVLLLDEPTSAMDGASEQRALAALHELAAGKTLIMVTHKMSIVGFAQRLVVIDAGQKIADGPRQAVIDALNQGKVQTGVTRNSAVQHVNLNSNSADSNQTNQQPRADAAATA